MTKVGFLVFLKGMLMGICDIIPGISGGSIAFITGIYARLIEAVRSFSPALVKDLFLFIFRRDRKTAKAVKDDIRKLDLLFLVTLFAGIGIAILLGSRLIRYLLDNHASFTLAFFIGLILASSRIIFDDIRDHRMKNVSFGVVGLLIGILFAFLIPATVAPSLAYVFLGGFIAISAMFLPGISGAFLLLIMGIYDFMIDVLHNIVDNVSYFIVFLIGAVLGAFTISRVISFLFDKDRCKTLYFLLGLVVGALSIPVKRVVFSSTTVLISDIVLLVLLFVVGVLVVFFVQWLKSSRKKLRLK